MKTTSILTVFAMAFFAMVFATTLCQPALAGSVNFANGRGNWQSTQCTPPEKPAELSKDPETAANDLNAQIALHNAYVAKVQAYMDCISHEAHDDAQMTGQLIVNTAKSVIQQAQEQIDASAAKLKR